MARKKKSNWKGGSFKAAVGGWFGRKAKRTAKRAKRGLLKGLRRCLWA